jgi:hypothetical protein
MAMTAWAAKFCTSAICLRRGLRQRIEYRLKVKGRMADDFEHVGGGGLLLQRFAQFIEQPRVLDGDDGSKVLYQRNIPAELAACCGVQPDETVRSDK